MKTGIYFCNCGQNISGKIDSGAVKDQVSKLQPGVYFQTVDFLCSEEGKAFLEKDLQEQGVERVVLGACSPRDHESTFMRCLGAAGLNPYLMQMVNIREQVAWVTADPQAAAAKAVRLLSAASNRVALHDPLQKREIDICPDALVIGAGPAGLKAALALAGAGRKVVVVEKTQVIGGMPVRYEELFPNMECGPCMLEPMLGEVLHGEVSGNIELLTLAEVTEVVGSYGNFTVTIKQQPRYVDTKACIGCQECIGPCPVSAKNAFDCNLSERKAISFPFPGALPNAPAIDPALCLRLKGGDCSLCRDACPVEGTIQFEQEPRVVQKAVGAVIVAIGGNTYDCSAIPNLGYGKVPDVVTALEFERMAASNGPTGGEIRTSAGTAPASVAIVHCVGSLDKNHKEYCSGICCQYAFKFNHLLGTKLPGIKRTHLYREISSPGKEEFSLYRHAQDDPDTSFRKYRDIKDLAVTAGGGTNTVRCKDASGKETVVNADMIILCPASVPAEGTEQVGSLLEAGRDKFGFFEELHSRTDSAQSKIKGIYLAGACQSPMDIQRSMSQGMAAAGFVLSGLVPGRKLEISPLNAVVDEEHCSGCRVCISVCPYKAISFDAEKEVARVNDVLCMGCGTCVAACPSGSIRANHFTNNEIMAEIEGILS